MHSRNSGKFARGTSATVKKISFKKETARHKNDQTKHSNNDDVKADLKPVQNGIENSTKLDFAKTAQPIASSSVEGRPLRHQIKVKRKSLVGISRCTKKRLSSVDHTIILPSDSNEGAINDVESVPNHSDSLSDFWGDDQLFADFNISDVVHSSIESSNKQINLASTPNVTKIMPREKGSEFVGPAKKGSESDELETFYGLPMNVKSMLSQYRGIEELYGEFNNLTLALVLRDGKKLL